jgi:MATE family multidrug resistance protein
MVGSVILGLLVCLICIFQAPWLSQAIGLSGEAEELSTRYIYHLGYAGLPLAISPMVDQAFIAMGRTRLVMGLHLVSTLANLALNFVLIYGLNMGIAGAAWASGISRALVLIPAVVILWRVGGLSFASLALHPVLRRVIRVGLPMGLNTAAYAGVYWALLRWVISPLGPEVNASLGIGFSALEGFTWPLFHGISLAVASLVGRCLGAGDLEGARQVGRIALPLSSAFGLGASLIFWLGAEPLCGVFTSDPGVLKASILYANILAVSQIFVAWEALSEGILAGAGDTRTVLWWSAPVNALRVPLGFFFAFNLGLGAAGIWWAINLTTMVKALAKGRAAMRGQWAELKI